MWLQPGCMWWQAGACAHQAKHIPCAYHVHVHVHVACAHQVKRALKPQSFVAMITPSRGCLDVRSHLQAYAVGATSGHGASVGWELVWAGR